MTFYNFLNFFAIFYGNFLARVWWEQNSEQKIFSLFLDLSHPGLDRNNARIMFFNFWNFFAICFWIFFPGLGGNGIQDKNCYLSFSAYLIPVWIEIMPEWRFLVFLKFLPFFLEFSSQGWDGTELGLNFFFLFLGQSHPGLDRYNVRMMFLNFFTFFFFWNFLARVGYDWNWGLKSCSLFLGKSHPGLDRNISGMTFFNFFAFFFWNFQVRVG